MKFSEVKIGSTFKYNGDYWIRITANGYAHNLNKVFLGGIKFDSEVELITKCQNCKWFGKNYLDGIKSESISCYKLSLDIGKDDFYRSINQDPENFSCSHFEMKEG